MTGMMPKKEAGMGNWIYSASTTVLEKTGLHTIGEYIQVRRQNIALFIVNRPIFDLCREGEEEGFQQPPILVDAIF